MESELRDVILQLHENAHGDLDSNTVAKQLTDKGEWGRISHQKVSATVRSYLAEVAAASDEVEQSNA